MTVAKKERAGSGAALRNIALGLDADAARELNDAADELTRLREALEGLMYFADRVLYSFNGDLSRHERWEKAASAARLALTSTPDGQK